MKKELSRSFYRVDSVLHASYWIVFAFCLYYLAFYNSNILNLSYSMISSFVLMIIAVTRLSLESIEYKRIIKNYEEKIKK